MKHHKVYRTELSPVSFLQRSAYVFPGKPAVVHGERQYTYRGIRGARQPARLGPAQAGLQKHDRVAFICPNIPAMLEAHYGIRSPAGCSSPSTSGSPPTRSATSSSTLGRRRSSWTPSSSTWSSRWTSRASRSCAVDDTGAPGDPTRISSHGRPRSGRAVLEDEKSSSPSTTPRARRGGPRG